MPIFSKGRTGTAPDPIPVNWTSGRYELYLPWKYPDKKFGISHEHRLPEATGALLKTRHHTKKNPAKRLARVPGKNQIMTAGGFFPPRFTGSDTEKKMVSGIRTRDLPGPRTIIEKIRRIPFAIFPAGRDSGYRCRIANPCFPAGSPPALP